MQKIKLMGTAMLGLAVASSPVLGQITAVGDGEGQVNIVAWAGYIEPAKAIQLLTGLPNLKQLRVARLTSRPPTPATKWLP